MLKMSTILSAVLFGSVATRMGRSFTLHRKMTGPASGSGYGSVLLRTGQSFYRRCDERKLTINDNKKNEQRDFSLSMVIDSHSTRTLTQAHENNTARSLSKESDGGSQLNVPTKQRLGLSLTTEERELLTLLRNVAEEHNSDTVLRVAGGWVRDKLLAEEDFFDESERLTSKRKQKTINIAMKRDGLEYDNTLNTEANTFDSGEVGTHTSSASIGSGGKSAVKRSFSESALTTSTKPVDIDIAINNMLGREFAELVNAYLSEHGKETHKVGVVLTNPDMSKHLETATLSIGNFWIDFVNLRTEIYKEEKESADGDKGTRVPVSVGIGSAQEDAFRRDLTINSLFYNLHSEYVEDFTGSGLADLRAKIVRTPIDPIQTFLDDPLRVLRSVRFASRLNFSLDTELRKTIRRDDIQSALVRKVSRERVGSEVDLMLRSSRPVCAGKMLYELNLMSCVFPLKDIPGVEGKDFNRYYRNGVQLLATTHSYLCSNVKHPPGWCKLANDADILLTNDEETRRLLWYACLFHPYMVAYAEHVASQADEVVPVVSSKKKQRKGKKSTQSPLFTLLLDELKRPSKDAQNVETIQECAIKFSDLVMNEGGWEGVNVLVSGVKVLPNDKNIVKDEDIENDVLLQNAMEFRLKCFRILKRCKNLWRASLVLSLCHELRRCSDDPGEEIIFERKVDVLSQYNAFALSLLRLNLIGIWNMKLLIDGDKIKANVLPNLPRGPLFRDVMDKQGDYMVRHPGCTVEMVENHLRNEFSQYV